MLPHWEWIPMSIPRPWGVSRRIVLVSMTWEETYGSGVRTCIHRIGPLAWFAARRGSASVPSVCGRRVATLAFPTVVIVTTVFGVFLGLRVRLAGFYAKAFICKS